MSVILRGPVKLTINDVECGDLGAMNYPAEGHLQALPPATRPDHEPRRRVTCSGHSIYGAHPSLGRRFWSMRPEDKIERRRVRSRIAAMCRGLAP